MTPKLTLKDGLYLTILKTVSENPGINLSQISRIIHPELSATPKKTRLQILESEGMVERRQSIKASSWAYYVTPKGEQFLRDEQCGRNEEVMLNA